MHGIEDLAHHDAASAVKDFRIELTTDARSSQ